MVSLIDESKILNIDQKTYVRKLSATQKTIKIALVGNPNAGKTTLFNKLTGSRQYVGNWPGVTVEKKQGGLEHGGFNIEILDLPGVYSLSPYSPEEIITRNCLLNDSIDLIINIVDAANLERNLYLTTQLAEFGKPMLVVLNMIDRLTKRNCTIDYSYLSTGLDLPVVPVSAVKGSGIGELLDKILECRRCESCGTGVKIRNKMYTGDIRLILEKINTAINDGGMRGIEYSYWLAVKLFEGDSKAKKAAGLKQETINKIEEYKGLISSTKYIDKKMMIADQRYRYICDLCRSAIERPEKHIGGKLNDKIDDIVTHKYLAIPVFLVVIFTIFYMTFGPVGSFLKEQFEGVILGDISRAVAALLSHLGASKFTMGLVVDGVIKGVGEVLCFLPQVAILFTMLSLLEDSGYMARIAFIMDAPLRKIGLSGKAFVPMLMGFGCTVPAVLGTKILENDRDRRLTILLVPFMSCSARMPVYAIFIGSFFRASKGLVLGSIYILGVLVAILTATILKKTMLRGTRAPFIMELPEYKLPLLKNTYLHVWERVKEFAVRATTMLVGATVVIWFLQKFGPGFVMVSDSSHSILAELGRFIAPIFGPCGFNDWRAAVALLCGVMAKEYVVSTMAVLYSGGGSLSLSISQNFTPLTAYAFMIFVLLYVPCVATISAIHKEMKSWRFTVFAVGYQLFVAWLLSAIFFQVGRLCLV